MAKYRVCLEMRRYIEFDVEDAKKEFNDEWLENQTFNATEYEFVQELANTMGFDLLDTETFTWIREIEKMQDESIDILELGQ